MPFYGGGGVNVYKVSRDVLSHKAVFQVSRHQKSTSDNWSYSTVLLMFDELAESYTHDLSLWAAKWDTTWKWEQKLSKWDLVYLYSHHVSLNIYPRSVAQDTRFKIRPGHQTEGLVFQTYIYHVSN